MSNKETKYFLSKEFKDNCSEQVKKDTWDKGLPMIYMDKKGDIVEHWKDGKTKIIEKAIIYLDDFNGQKKTLLKTDRTRTVNYNGNELNMNTYGCSSCKTYYFLEEIKHKFCPFCGAKYKYTIDISI